MINLTLNEKTKCLHSRKDSRTTLYSLGIYTPYTLPKEETSYIINPIALSVVYLPGAEFRSNTDSTDIFPQTVNGRYTVLF